MTDTKKPQETVNHTLDGQQDKAEPALPEAAQKAAKPAAKPQKTLDECIVLRATDIEDFMRDKERLMLGYVEKKVPKPYYVQWKSEANEFYALLVNLKHRRARQKAG
jgi:hypothetical protein